MPSNTDLGSSHDSSATDSPREPAGSDGRPAKAARSFDVIIVGGGVTGCAAAAALADGRRRIAVLEARSGHKPRFAGELIHPTGAQVLDDLGFLPELRSRGGIDVDGFAVVKSPEDPVMPLPYREIPKTRPTGFAMEHRDLVDGMRAVVGRLAGVSYFAGTPVEEIMRDGSGRAIGVRAGGETIRARLVLGCDGRHSKVRPLLGLSEKARLLSFSVAFRLPGGAPLLPQPGFGHIFLGAWGPMLIYPIGGHAHAADRSHPGDARGCFDVTTELSGGPRGAAERLRRDYAPYLPPQLRDAMLASLDRELPQIAANEAIRTDRSVVPEGGAAIVGDAGGCSHPLTATGMTVGFTDAARLGRLLAGIDLSEGSDPARSNAAVDRALRTYDIERYRFVRAREILADALYEVFRAAEPGTRAIREGIFRYWETSERARASSMALLSGADSRLGVFLKEYLTVVRTGCTAALLGETGPERGQPATPRERFDSLMGLAGKSLEKFKLVVRDVSSEVKRATFPA